MTRSKKLNINRLDAHHKLYVALTLAAICWIVTRGELAASTQFMVVWLTYALISLTLSALTIFNVHPAVIHQDAHAQDSSKTLVFLFAIFASVASLFAIVLLLRSGSGSDARQLTLHVLLSLACVVASWVLVHTIFTFRYAHYYYCDIEDGQDSKTYKPGGLAFPNEPKPDYLDFAYFSFVIGMTFQVSDVQITSRRIRRLALLHGLLAFSFNTIIVALSINVIAGLVQK
ncbi:DUF1345 domain-containing protein [Mucilaginibacter rubeus]|uniref:DUF1345 domain-containing protein n=2 Tax=Mucilaginibacter rubeus TaxID=2027860 RepID=A0A364WWK4_9SPHI|nr:MULTISPECIES: DUF1345 domain-containing protein [Mucilaginibacter]QEM06173.1 DUF1345 domain-containing protein [Mucilaginibacter rubeus]QEM13690.1 DUF1345 domain-containing protein [Mucilaginibacter rubeus]QEM18755.1 DUF1345 domain-containing protein [Mucilaginibacter gossypii]QTE36251.1 DUF1345 domain-containing protein [Mucilaginibacter gossypii]QTE44704.1 DUF1345 domain-containing protein [Mucilaginibacter rubeus]